MSRRKKKYLEGIIEKVNFPNMSEFTFEDKKVNFKGGIEGQKVSVVVGRKREKHMEAKLLEILEKVHLKLIQLAQIIWSVVVVAIKVFLMNMNSN